MLQECEALRVAVVVPAQQAVPRLTLFVNVARLLLLLACLPPHCGQCLCVNGFD